MTGHAASSGSRLKYSGPPISGLAKRIHGWSWQAFPIGMGTGAVYITLAGLHDHPPWVTHFEVFFYFLNIAFFLLNSSTLLLQFILYRKQSLRLLFDPVKGVFVPLIVLSFATIIIGTINYAIPNGHIHPGFIYELFWVYVTIAVVVCMSMLMIWFNSPHDITEFTPAYAFLVFPMMLVGIVALNVLRVLEPTDSRAIGVLLVGYFFQGIGFFMTFFYLTLYILRIFTTGFLDGHQANGAFVACGPPGFTALALIKLGESAMKILPAFGLISPLAGEIWYAASVLAALMLFGLAVFFFIFAVLPYWFKLHKHLHQILGCWAITFPNVGWISAMKVIGDVFQLRALWILHAIFAVIMVMAWVILFFLTGLAFYRGKIFLSDDVAVASDTMENAEMKQSFIVPATPVAPQSGHGRPPSFDMLPNKDEKEAALDAYYARQHQSDLERGQLRSAPMSRPDSWVLPSRYQNMRPPQGDEPFQLGRARV